MNNYYKLAKENTIEKMNEFLQRDENNHLDFVMHDLNVTEFVYYAYIGLEHEMRKINE